MKIFSERSVPLAMTFAVTLAVVRPSMIVLMSIVECPQVSEGDENSP